MLPLHHARVSKRTKTKSQKLPFDLQMECKDKEPFLLSANFLAKK
jgi:hypothetical protein